jgi:hypothetical protein
LSTSVALRPDYWCMFDPNRRSYIDLSRTTNDLSLSTLGLILPSASLLLYLTKRHGEVSQAGEMVALLVAPSSACAPSFMAVPYGACGGNLARAQALINGGAHPSMIGSSDHGVTKEVSLPYTICIFLFTQNHLFLHGFG